MTVPSGYDANKTSQLFASNLNASKGPSNAGRLRSSFGKCAISRLLMCVVRQQALFVVITLRQERAVALEIVLIHGSGRVLTGFGNGARRGAEREARTQPGVEVVIAECLLERSKRRLAGAVARRDVRHFEAVAQ